MASIKLQGFEQVKPQKMVQNPNPKPSIDKDDFVYRDIRFDLQFDQDSTNLPDGTSVNTQDLADLKDVEDIKQALNNIFNTSPGQKLLNPYFGLNLTHYCFDPITRITADHIARTVLVETPQQDSRINIKHLTVEGDIDSSTYDITFSIIVPGSTMDVVNIKGVLNADGFSIQSI